MEDLDHIHVKNPAVRVTTVKSCDSTDSGEYKCLVPGDLGRKQGRPLNFSVQGWIVTRPSVNRAGEFYLPEGTDPVLLTIVVGKRGDPRLLADAGFSKALVEEYIQLSSLILLESPSKDSLLESFATAKAGELGFSVSEIKRALSPAGKQTGTYVSGLYAAEAGAYNLSEARITKSLEDTFDPDGRRARFTSLGSVHLMAYKPQSAKVSFLRAEHQGGADSFVYTGLGTAAAKQGKFDEAEYWYRRALAFDQDALGVYDPTVTCTLSNLVFVSVKQNKPEQANAWAEQAIDFWRSDVGMLDTCGHLGIGGLKVAYEDLPATGRTKNIKTQLDSLYITAIK